MNDLPNELLLLTFKHLEIKDLIQCRLVCKRFMLICDEVHVPEIIISSEVKNIKEYWFHTHKQFNHKDAINVQTFTMYRSTFRLDKFLKRLHFKGSYSDFDLLNLNGLAQLEQLTIDIKISNDNYSKRIDINLPNLKVLEIGEQYDYDEDPRKFHLTLPKLETLKCHQYDSIFISDPITVKHLELTFYTEAAHALKNVEYLKFDWKWTLYDNILSVYPKLRTLVCCEFDDEEDNDGTFDTLQHLVELKRTLGRPVKIYFQSVELVDQNKIEECVNASSILAFQINNFNLLCDNINFDDHLDYNHVMELVNGTLPANFFKKFFKFQAVKVTGKVKNQKHFVWFLKNLEFLSRLDLEDPCLDQNFYDCLDEIGQLTELNLRQSSERGSNSAINYNFLLKLTLLETFTTDYVFPDCSYMTFQLYSRLKYFRSIYFYFDKKCIAISKERCTNGNTFKFGQYKVTAKGPRVNLSKESNMDLDELVRLIDAYQNSRL